MSASYSGGNDNGSSDSSVESLLVGTWGMYDGSSLEESYAFNSDGTGNGVEYDSDGNERDVWTFQWSYDESTRILEMSYRTEDGDKVDSFYIDAINDSTVQIYWVDEDTGKVDYSDGSVLSRLK